MALITNYWGLDGIIVLTTLMAAAYLYMTRKFNYWKKRGVVELPPTPFFGNFSECMFLQKNPGYYFSELYTQAKGLPYLGFYIFDRPSLLIRDRDLIRNILVKDFNHFTDRNGMPDTKDRLGCANLFFIKNPVWKILRTKLTPVFTSGKLKKMFDLMLECADNLEAYLESLGLENEGKVVDVKDMSAKFTTDLISSTAFGINANSLNNPDAEFRKYGKMSFDYDYIRGFQIFAMFFLPTISRMTGIKFFGEESTKFLRSAFWEAITQRMKTEQKRNDLIDILIELKKQHGDEDIGGFKFDGDDLVAQAAVFFAAGFETSSTVTGLTLYELALQPDIQNRLRKEIHDALKKNGGKVTYEMALSLPYLDTVVSETLRKYPTLSFLDRTTNETYKVPNSDLVIEKGTPIYISMLGVHMDPEYFPKPEKYDPERFNEANKRTILPYTYFPFGEGPRACIGTRLGLLQSKLGIIAIFNKYETRPCEKTIIPMVLDPKASFSSPLGGGIYLNMRKLSTKI